MNRKRLGLYGVICGILLLLVVALISFSAVTAEDGADMAIQIPRKIELKRHEYGDFETKKSNIIMGQGVGELIIEAAPKNRYMITYGAARNECRLNSIYIKDGLAHYCLDSSSGDTKLSIELCRPVSKGDQQIAGKWAFCLRASDGTVLSEWFVFKEDGTGILGWGNIDAVAATEEQLAEQGFPFTWTLNTLNSGGALVAASFQNGEIVVLARM